MNEKKISRNKFLTLGLITIIALLSLFEVNALTIESIKFIGASADLKINVTIKNPGADTTTFNLTLEDTTNDEKKQVIYSGILTIGGNRTHSYIFGRYSAYDYSLNENWENFRCGKHSVQAKIIINGSTRDAKIEDVYLYADNFDLTFSPDIETGKISPPTRVNVIVKGVDGRGIEHARVIITDGDTRREKRTDSRGRVDFRISDLFSPPATGRYTLKILKNEPVRGRYYCNYKKDFDVKKRLNISSIVPASPKVNERITLTLDSEDYVGIWLAIEGPKSYYYTLTDRINYFTIDTPGVYKISVTRGRDYWTDERTIVVEEYPELRIVNFSEILLGRENEFVVLDANNVRVANAKVTLNGISKMSDSNGVVKFTITNPGTYRITAEKANYKTGHKTLTVLKKLRMIFEPEKPKIYDNVKIKLFDEKGLPVDGTIIIENKHYPTREGYITYNFTKFINYKIIGKAQDFADVEINLKPLKILNIIINKAENEEFSVGEILNVMVEGDDLHDARIEIKNLDTNITLSAYTLNYSTTLLTPGNYEIIATATGFGDAKRKFSVRHLTMEIKAKYDVQNNKILITVISDGKGLENVTVSVITPKKLIGKYKTDKDGKVIFDAIYEEGNYTIIAEKIHYETKQQSVEVKKQGFEWFWIIIIIALLIGLLVVLFIKRKKAKDKGADEIYESRLG